MIGAVMFSANTLFIFAAAVPASHSSYLRIPGMQLPFRLRGKQTWPKKGRKVRKITSAKKACTHRHVAVTEGVAPKARRPFALFVRENNEVEKGSSRLAFAAEMRRLGAMWASLPDADKAKYRERCLEEFAKQRQALRLHVVCPFVTVAGNWKLISWNRRKNICPNPSSAWKLKLK